MSDIVVYHDDYNVSLRGFAFVSGTRLIVESLEPGKGQKYIDYGWAAGVCGSEFWLNKDGNFTRSGLAMAKTLLLRIYEETRPEYIQEQKKIKIDELKRQIEKIENE